MGNSCFLWCLQCLLVVDLSCCLIGFFPEFEVKFCLIVDLRSTKRSADESHFDFDDSYLAAFFLAVSFGFCLQVMLSARLKNTYTDVVHHVLAGIANSSIAGLARPHSSTPDTSNTQTCHLMQCRVGIRAILSYNVPLSH
jgi:hypothetical protein